jgi:hypothetical protein
MSIILVRAEAAGSIPLGCDPPRPIVYRPALAGNRQAPGRRSAAVDLLLDIRGIAAAAVWRAENVWRSWQVVAAAAVLVGCGTANDTEEMVRAALLQSNIRDVDVVADEGVVRLTGQVDTLADRTRAVELAAAIAGAGARVENGIAVTGLGPLGNDAADGGASLSPSEGDQR